jgi:hypothetical protein
VCYLDLFASSLLSSFTDRVGAFVLLGVFS